MPFDPRPQAHRTARFDAVPSSVQQARHTVAQALTDWGLTAGLRQDVQQIVAELAANSVRHAGGLSPVFTVTAVVGDGHVAVGVHDRHPSHPCRVPGGRGLGMVAALVAEVGGVTDVQETDDGGKTVWAVVPLAAN